MTKITIRSATVADIPAIRAMGEQSRQAVYVETGLLTEAENTAAFTGAWSDEMLTISITNPANHAIVIMNGEHIIGYLSGRYKEPRDEGEVRLYRIYVHPGHWGRQIGYRLWQNYRAAVSADVQRIDVGVMAGNERANKFYRQLGFQIVGPVQEGHYQLQLLLT